MMLKKLSFLFVFLSLAHLCFAQDFPEKSNTLVTDYTNTLSAPDKQALENKLDAFNDSTSTQIAIVIIKSVGDYDINEYGAGLGRKWGIGEKGKNNGILILVAIDDHKMTIQTGYGVEGALPDVIAYQIRTKEINPYFQKGDYYGGLNTGTDDIIKYTKGEYKADPAVAKNQSQGGAGSAIVLIIIVIIILIVIFRNRGGGGHVIGSGGGASPFWWFLAGSMLGSGDRSGGWGGFSGGNDGGGGDSGGFGGFGGGDFGGGGSGGSW